jgi:transcriptional regulator with XRE-family HTH domain
MSVEDLAARIDCEASTVRRWERGGSTPSARHMPALRAALSIPLDSLDEACLAGSRERGGGPRIEGVEHLARTGMSYEALLGEVIALDRRNIDILDEADEGTPEQWGPIFRLMPQTWRLMVDDGRIVGNWHFISLNDAAFARAKAGALRDGEIALEDIDLISFPGVYNVYLSSFVLDQPFRFGRPFQMMFDSLIDALTRFATNGIFFREVVTPGFSIEGRKLCERLGFERIGDYCGRDNVPVLSAALRPMTARPEFARHEYLRQLYDGA